MLNHLAKGSLNLLKIICIHSNRNILPLLSVTNQYSAALNLYLQAGAVCSDFFTKAVPPDVYTDQAGLPFSTHQPLQNKCCQKCLLISGFVRPFIFKAELTVLSLKVKFLYILTFRWIYLPTRQTLVSRSWRGWSSAVLWWTVTHRFKIYFFSNHVCPKWDIIPRFCPMNGCGDVFSNQVVCCRL